MNGLENAKIVFIPESNLAWEGTHQSKLLKKSGVRAKVITMYEDGNRAGIRTNADLKRAMALSLKKKINKSIVKFHKDFFSVSG